MNDVTKLVHITPEELDQLVGDNDELFSLLVVAEAVLTSPPLGIVTWLRQLKNVSDWLDTLIVYEGKHQISWWKRQLRLGDNYQTVQARRSLAAIRARLPEAQAIEDERLKVGCYALAEHAAHQQLQKAHAEEYAALIASLRLAHDLPEHEPITPAVQQLLDLDEAAFRDLVGKDVQARVEVDHLMHSAVLKRWRDALRYWGNVTLGMLDQPLVHTEDYMHFVVPDTSLPSELQEGEINTWSRRLTFLAHMRTRLLECSRQSRLYEQKHEDKVLAPAAEQLRSRHFVEYSRYRIGEEHKARLLDDTGVPPDFEEHKACLESLGWAARIVRDGPRVWVDAYRGEHRLTVAMEREQAEGGSSLWKESASYFAHNPMAGWYTLPAFEAVVSLAEFPPDVYRKALGLIDERQRVTDPTAQRCSPPF
ncbi:hypothetical protein [Streptosporangium sp. V21-05]|uniref:hypothetical protein n=1 Tax=Streptosporangium sp. V21-05 TaxID=3446115 RepID=UPI003F52D927